VNIALAYPAFPPTLDGIGDHTACLAAELSKRARVSVLTEEQKPTEIPGVSIHEAFSIARPQSVRSLMHAVQTVAPDWLMLQYNPFGYGRWGLNPYLPLVVRSIKRLRRTKIALMVHEPFVPVESWKFAIMTTWQRWQLWMLGRSADVVLFSIEPWANRFRSWWPNKPVQHLPVGSNIPRLSITRTDARERNAIREHTTVIGVFGTAHPSRMLNWVRDAAKEVLRYSKDDVLLYIGPGGEKVQAVLRGIPLLDVGVLTSEGVSQHFAAMDVYLAPFTDGVSTRRSSFMVGLQHSIPTVSTVGYSTDNVLLKERDEAFFLAPVTSAKEFNAKVTRLTQDAELRSKMGAKGRRLYESEFAWNVIADRLLTYLEVYGRDEQAVGSSVRSTGVL
jgi:glycosyltransferase involved in cell wall biosynthesis